MKWFSYTLIISIIGSIINLNAQPSIVLSEIATGLRNAVDIAHAGDDRLFIVEQVGIIQVLDANRQIASSPLLNIQNKVRFGGERGLLGLAFHPNFSDNGYFYVNYTNSSGNTNISRFKLEAGATTADANSELILFSVNQPYNNHNGGCLKFGPDGYLYIGLGDGGLFADPMDVAQNNASLLGKILRIDVDNGEPYSIPPDNPFVNNSSVSPEIWASGLRNPWKFSFDRVTQDLWIGDVGQNDFEEINFVPANTELGLDFGWRCYEGNSAFNLINCQAENTFYFPVHEYPTISSVGKSVTGGYVYRGAQNPNLVGHYIYGDYISGRIWSLISDGNQFKNTELLKIGLNEISSFGEDASGELYLVTYMEGKLYQIQSPIVSSTTATEKLESLTIFPNPSQEMLTLNFEQLADDNFKLKIVNLYGQEVYKHPSIITNTTSIDIAKLDAGFYYLIFESTSGFVSRKFVKTGNDK